MGYMKFLDIPLYENICKSNNITKKIKKHLSALKITFVYTCRWPCAVTARPIKSNQKTVAVVVS